MNTDKYEGSYRIGSLPKVDSMKPHNAKPWTEIKLALSDRNGTASYKTLKIAVRNHESGSKNQPHPYQFVQSCIRQGWLKKV